jgi:hypothetical protein
MHINPELSNVKEHPNSSMHNAEPFGQDSLDEIDPFAAELDWQRAQQRVVCYLRALKVPALKALELAQEALTRAQQDFLAAPSSHPVTHAMRALRGLLAEQSHPSTRGQTWGCLVGHGSLRPLACRGKDICRGIASMPPVNRGSMVPKERDLGLWRSVIGRLFKAQRGRSRGIRNSAAGIG